MKTKKIITRVLESTTNTTEQADSYKGTTINKEIDGKLIAFEFLQFIPSNVKGKSRLTFVAKLNADFPLSNANVNWNYVFELNVEDLQRVLKYPEYLSFNVSERKYSKRNKKVIPSPKPSSEYTIEHVTNPISQ